MWSLAVLALCLSPIYANTPSSSSIVITYDDIVSNPVANEADPIPSPYKQLVFKRFDARANRLGPSVHTGTEDNAVPARSSKADLPSEKGASILRSVSGNNTAASNELNNVLAGKTPNITSDYTGSPVAFFDLVSTYVGCAVTTELTIGAPQKCTIQFKGVNTNGKTVSALCNYDAKQRRVEFCDFKGQLNSVRYVTVVPTDTDTLPATTVEVLDNTAVVRELEIDVPGTRTRVILKTLPLGSLVSAPDVYMSVSAGLYRIAQGIARRGIGSPLSAREMEIYIGSSSLVIDHSAISLHYMTLGYMADLLYALSESMWQSHWFQEASIDIWNGPPEKRIHVGSGVLTHRGSPLNENTATA
ncbi:MAG: hypothetical protein Q9191_000661 [Dirinaria sp. TL-2023a]